MLIKSRIVLIIVIILNVCSSANNLIDKPVPLFRLKDINEKIDTYFSLQESLKNDSSDCTIISFFASWCTPCKLELPYLQSVSDSLKNVKLIAILTDKTYDDQQKKFIKDLNLNCTIVHDKYGLLSKRYELKNELPVTIFVDKRGIVRKFTTGFNDESKKQILDTVKGIIK